MFRDKSVVITGASSGLGAALAVEFAGLGARLTLFSRTADDLQAVAAKCVDLGAQALVVVGDVTAIEDCRRLATTAVERHGGIDYLVANAGLSMWSAFEQVEELEIFRQLTEVNYLGAVNCIHTALPYLRRRRGMIVAITSIQALIGVPQHTGYVASKHALQGFCDALRLELRESGVDILTVLPHWLRGTQLRGKALGSSGRPIGASSRKHSSESVSLEVASRAIVHAASKRRRRLIIPWKLKLLVWLNTLRPVWAERFVMRAMNNQERS